MTFHVHFVENNEISVPPRHSVRSTGRRLVYCTKTWRLINCDGGCDKFQFILLQWNKSIKSSRYKRFFQFFNIEAQHSSNLAYGKHSKDYWFFVRKTIPDDRLENDVLFIGGSRGGRTRRTPPLRVQILTFRHTKFSKHNRLGSPRPPPYEVHAPPPYGES